MYYFVLRVSIILYINHVTLTENTSLNTFIRYCLNKCVLSVPIILYQRVESPELIQKTPFNLHLPLCGIYKVYLTHIYVTKMQHMWDKASANLIGAGS